MHESTLRLLEFAKEATATRERPVTSFADVSRALSITSATMTNWKSRGVSKEGALAAEAAFGCSALWVLEGRGPAAKAGAPITSSDAAAQPGGTNDWRELSEGERATLDDIRDLPAAEREALRLELRERAGRYRQYVAEAMERMRASPEPATRADEIRSAPVTQPPRTMSPSRHRTVFPFMGPGPDQQAGVDQQTRGKKKGGT